VTVGRDDAGETLRGAGNRAVSNFAAAATGGWGDDGTPRPDAFRLQRAADNDELLWQSAVVVVDGQPTTFEQFCHKDRYWVAVGHVGEVFVTLSTGGLPIEDVRLERLADPPPFPEHRDRARPRRPILRRLLRLPRPADPDKRPFLSRDGASSDHRSRILVGPASGRRGARGIAIPRSGSGLAMYPLSECRDQRPLSVKESNDQVSERLIPSGFPPCADTLLTDRISCDRNPPPFRTLATNLDLPTPPSITVTLTG
jgi:hypothetical protein